MVVADLADLPRIRKRCVDVLVYTAAAAAAQQQLGVFAARFREKAQADAGCSRPVVGPENRTYICVGLHS